MNSACRCRCMQWPITVPLSTLRAANKVRSKSPGVNPFCLRATVTYRMLPSDRFDQRIARNLIGADAGHLTPADVYFGRRQTILIERERIKRQTIANRRLLHRRQAA